MSTKEQHAAQCRIVESQLPLLRLAGHNMLLLFDENGKLLFEIDGLATSKTGKVKPIGYLPSDRLKVYVFTHATYYHPDQAQADLMSGSREDLENRISAARAAANAINLLNLRYPFLGFGKNSNSVASTLIRVMGLIEPEDLPGGALWTPGQGQMVLDDETIQRIQDEFHIRPISDTISTSTRDGRV